MTETDGILPQQRLLVRWVDSLTRLPDVEVIWLEGSLVDGRAHRWSDIDLRVAVADEAYDRLWEAVRANTRCGCMTTRRSKEELADSPREWQERWRRTQVYRPIIGWKHTHKSIGCLRRCRMNDQEFWRIIGLFNWKKAGDDEAVLKPAVKELAKKSIEEIAAFEEILSQKLHALDTKAHARNIGEDAYVDEEEYFSVDWFLYTRCCVVANGRELYETVLNDPEQFPKDMEFEALLGLASAAYEAKTRRECEGFDTSVSYETYSNQLGWAT
jgi:hypothetical protein